MTFFTVETLFLVQMICSYSIISSKIYRYMYIDHGKLTMTLFVIVIILFNSELFKTQYIVDIRSNHADVPCLRMCFYTWFVDAKKITKRYDPSSVTVSTNALEYNVLRDDSVITNMTTVTKSLMQHWTLHQCSITWRSVEQSRNHSQTAECFTKPSNYLDFD